MVHMRRTQKGENYKYDIDISTNSEFIYITLRTTSKIYIKLFFMCCNIIISNIVILHILIFTFILIHVVTSEN